MAVYRQVLASCLLLALLAGQTLAKPAPVLVWSNGKQLASLTKGSVRTAYESLGAASVAQELVKESGRFAVQGEAVGSLVEQELTVLFLGNKLTVQDLSRAEGLEPLRAALEKAGSSLALPHVEFGADSSLAGQVQAALATLPSRVHSVDACDAEAALATLRELAAAPSAQGVRDVVLVNACPSAPLAAQVALVGDVQAAVDAASRPHTMAFAGEPMLQVARRSLLDYGLPDGVTAADLAKLQAQGAIPAGLTADQLKSLAGQASGEAVGQAASSGLSEEDVATAAALAAAGGRADNTASSGAQSTAAGSKYVQPDLPSVQSSLKVAPVLPPGIDPRELPFNLCPVGSQCQTQVRQFEIVILGITMIIALAIGFFMLHILDTPSRFELPKDTSARSE